MQPAKLNNEYFKTGKGGIGRWKKGRGNERKIKWTNSKILTYIEIREDFVEEKEGLQ